MRRHLLIIILIAITAITTSAQESGWSVWFYDADNAQAVQVDNAGAILNTESLPVPANYAPGTFALSRGLAVSHDGTRLAYSVTGTDMRVDNP